MFIFIFYIFLFDLILLHLFFIFFFFFNDTATTEIYTLSLHDALPISPPVRHLLPRAVADRRDLDDLRSEEHTSELQSHSDLVCRLLLEKKKTKNIEDFNLIQKKTRKTLKIVRIKY